MLNQFAVTSLNHLLAQASWACDKLKPHAGRVALLVSTPVALRLQIDAEGRFAEASADTPVDATIELPTAAVPQILHGFDAVSRQVSVSGNADFAETLGYVLRNLHWDVEEDLSKVFGDIVAHRLIGVFNQFFAWQKSAARNLAESTADYLTEENPVLLHPQAAAGFAAETDALRDDLARLEKRIERIERVEAK